MNDKNIGYKQSQRGYALAAGGALIMMAIAAACSYGFIHGQLIVQEDAEATLQNLLGKQELWSAELFGWLVIVICDRLHLGALYVPKADS